MKKPKRFVRSTFNLGDFNDNEVYDLEKEPSLTDPSQDETIQELVDRMVRGELLGNTKRLAFDITDKNAQGDPFEALPATSVQGFDLADAPVILERGNQAVSELKKPKGSKVAKPIEKPQEGPLPVDSKTEIPPKEAV